MGGKAYEAFGRYTRVHTRRFGESFERRYARFCGCGETLGRHRERRSSARFFLWTWALLALVFLVTPAYAVVDYSEMGIAWGPTTVDASTSPRQVGEILVTNSKNNAAVLVVGGNLLDSRLDHDVMAKLSNEGTGGAFYVLTQLVHRYYGSDGEYDYPNWSNWGQFDTLANVYGRDYIFWIQCTEAQIASAKEDYNAVLNGADLGGGSGGGGQIGSGVYQFSGNVRYRDYSSSNTGGFYTNGITSSGQFYTSGYYTGTNTSIKSIASPLNVKIDTTLPYDTSEYDYFMYLNNWPYSGERRIWLYIYAVKKGTYTITTATETHTGQTIISGLNSMTDGYYQLGSYNAGNDYNYDGSYLQLNATVSSVYYKYNGSVINASNTMLLQLQQSGPPVPPTNWPENPTVTPTPTPEPPSTTPVYPPQVTGPDVTVPQTPDLSDILDALNEHCMHLQDAIYNGFNDYYETITSYYSDVVDWLQDWFEYFDEQLDSYFRQDIGIGKIANQWLSQIYNKLDDIDAKMDGLGGKLESNDIPSSYDDSNVATDGSSVLAGAYNSLRTKFPFSLLDSLANFATRLKHQAVAPDFDLPVGNPFGNNDPFTVEIDLTPYSDWAAIVRTGEVLAVYVALARRAAAMWTREGEGA